jgi:hypothetical protein
MDRLQSHPEISKQYYDFLYEYLEFSYMETVTESKAMLFKPVYIPHHAVVRDSSNTTKLRVFNVSCKTRDDTLVLNNYLLIGPKLQQDLPIIIVRWCQWRYIYTVNIAKMFRQILMDPGNVDFQKILPNCRYSNSDYLPLCMA